MTSSKTYLVPIDFSKSSELALNYAIRLTRENRGRLLLVHVITDPAQFVPIQVRAEYYKELERKAQGRMKRLIQRKKLRTGDCRSIVIRGGNAARLISDQAKRSRVTMIVMGSHGRTGLRRFILGSVAERTLRYAKCPILIVKR